MKFGSWMQRLLLAVLTLGTMAAAANPRDGLDVRVSAAQPVLRGDVDVSVEVSVTNVTRHPVRVLRWQLPGAETESMLFRITHEDGSAARYTGPLVKRVKPDADDIVKIDGGATLTYTVELTESYDLSRSGRYTIEYASLGERGATASLNSQPMYLWLEGRSAKAAAVAAPTPAAKSLSYASCKASQQTQIATAVASATTYAANASAYLNANNQGPRYTTWFGAVTSSRYNTVKSNFSALATAFNTADVVVDCSCRQKKTYAYVYSNQPYRIYVCGAFWTAPATGTDSKAGTLVHEMSHFTVVAGTADNAYGQSAAKALAISNPDAAVDNADSHEYFAENTPAQN